MGVTGLWKLIEPCGKPVPVETLEGKVLAVDISIWLHQVVKGYQDNKGSVLPQAHLLGLFHRLCKLLYYRIRPVFVFDGSVPQLKQDTIARRQRQRSKLNNETERIQALLLESLAKERVVQQALGASVEMLLKSPSKRSSINANSTEQDDDLFKLPLPANEKNEHEVREEEEPTLNSSLDDLPSSSFSNSDSSMGESDVWKTYNTNLQAIDIHTQQFRNLPPEVRHEILIDIKETRKQSSWGRLHELPPCSVDFSSLQMKKLLKRRDVQKSLEETEKEMEDPTLNYNELKEFFTEEGIVQPTDINLDSKQIYSDEHTRFLLVHDLKTSQSEKKKLFKGLSNINESSENDTEISVAKSEVNLTEQKYKEKKKLDIVDTDLLIALQLSLEEGSTHVYSEKDYEHNSNECLKLSNEQRSKLQNVAKGPARSYMMEYGGMNDVRVIENVQKTDADNSTMDKGQKQSFAAIVNDDDNEHEESQEMCLRVSDDSESDSNFEEVGELEASLNTKANKKEIEIVLNTEKLLHEDDLFADVFSIPEENKLASIQANDFQKIKLNSEDASLKNLVPKIFEDSCESKDVKLNVINTEGKDNTENLDETESQSKYLKHGKEANKKFCEHINMQAKQEDINCLLDELKHQADTVRDIKLDGIELPNIPTIEISDDEKYSETVLSNKLDEVIEIYDSDHKQTLNTTLTKSPSTKASISDYFETKYFVKRTPDKSINEEEMLTPKVQSPFFVERSPSLGRKRTGTNSPSRVTKLRKASKSLFKGDTKINDTEASKKEEVIETLETSNSLQSAEELQHIAADLAKEKSMLEIERNRQDRMGTSINQRMKSDCQMLLRLFGIPYLVAPMEAEAQCAYLDAVDLTNGTITDDSDIWLFGGQTVYRNFFEQNKHVLEFKSARIEHLFNCDRKKLIQLACLVGSDYTNGVHGIGAVTALEILASFSTLKNLNAEKSFSEKAAVLSTLTRFRDWWKLQKSTTSTSQSSTLFNLKKKLQNIELNNEFPNPAVIEAYLNPKIDDNKEVFSWGHLDVESIQEFTKKTFGWTTKKTNDILTPVLKKINEKRTQASIRNYFTSKGVVATPDIKVSKRVRKAIDTMANKPDNAEKEKNTPGIHKTRNKRVSKTRKEHAPNMPSGSKDLDCNDTMSSEPDNTRKNTLRVRKKRSKQECNDASINKQTKK